MPYKSEAQRKYFNVNRKKLEAQGVDVDEWNQSSKGKKLPEKKANTPGQTGNIPVTPPAAVRPTAAPSAHIPHLARRQTTLADAQGVKGAAAKNTATPFFYLLAKAAANYAKQANDALTPFPIPDTSNPADAPSFPLTRTDLNFDPIPPSIADVKIPSFSQLTQPKSLPKVAPAATPNSSTPSWLQRLTEFAGTPAGMATGAGLGLGGLGLGAGMYLGSRRRKDDEDEKEAGYGSEITGALLNPLNHLGGNALGGIASLLTPTRNLSQQLDSDNEILSNLLIPGRGVYNASKRIGASTRSPEMLALQQKHREEKNKSKKKPEKAANAITEGLSTFNPLNAYGGAVLGAGAALATPTQRLSHLAKRDENSGVIQGLLDILVPGVGPYNAAKRLGTMIRSPEIKQLRSKNDETRRQQQLKQQEDDVADEAEVMKTLAKLSADESLSAAMRYIGIPALLTGGGAAIGAGLGAVHHPFAEMFEKNEDPDARNKRLKERVSTGALVGSGAGLGQSLSQFLQGKLDK